MIIEAGGPKAVHSSARIEPKYTHYAPHGCGWDSYIIVNNGGAFALRRNAQPPDRLRA
jgi:hypothetical protein